MFFLGGGGEGRGEGQDLHVFGNHFTCELLESMHEDDLFDIFPEFSSKVVYILAVIPATSCSAERSFSALGRLTKLTSAALWGSHVSATLHLLTLKGHMPTL